MFLSILFLITLSLNHFVQNTRSSNCIFRKSGYDDFIAEDCLHILKLSSNETHVLIPGGFEHFCYVPTAYENATLHCFDMVSMVSPCLSVLNDGMHCCAFVKDGYENFEPKECLRNSFTAYTTTYTLAPITPDYYCKIPFIYENIRPTCISETLDYQSRNRGIYRFPQKEFSHINCEFVTDDDDEDTYKAEECVYFSAISSIDTHVLVPTSYSEYCFVPKTYANAQRQCLFHDEYPNCTSVVRGVNSNVCCLFSEEGYENYEPTECFKINSLIAFNETHLLREVYQEGFYCYVPWKYETSRPRCVLPVATTPAKYNTDANGNPLQQGNVVNLG